MTQQHEHIYVVVKYGPGRGCIELAKDVRLPGAMIAAAAFANGHKDQHVPNPRCDEGTSWLGRDGSTVYIFLDTRPRQGPRRVPFTYEEATKLIRKSASPKTYSGAFGPVVITPEIA